MIGYGIDRSEAVSEEIGVVLMISVVVIGISIAGVVLIGMDTPVELPSLSMIPGTDGTDLFLYHSGGDSLKRGEFIVRVDGRDYYPADINLIDQSGNAVGDWDSWDLGESLEISGKSDYNQILILSTQGGQGSIIAGNGDGAYTSAPTSTTTATSTATTTSTTTVTPTSTTATPTATVTETPTPTPAPVADFTADPTSGFAPLEVTFTDLSTENPTSWYWNFGDGSTSTNQNPVHEYSSAGTYTVSLNASSPYGSDIEEKSDYIVAQTLKNIVLDTPRPFYLMSGGYFEFDATGPGSITHDGSSVSFTAGSKVRIELASDQPGTIDMGSTYFSDFSFDDVYLYIDGTPHAGNGPITSISINGFSVSKSTLSMVVPYPGGTNVTTYLEVDGNIILPWWPDYTPEVHIYNIYQNSAGTLQLSSKPRLVCGAGDYELINPPAPPVAEFSASPLDGDAPLSVTFTDLSSGNPTSWYWDFGDGVTDTDKNPVHEYYSKGWKQVSLTVSNDGGSDTITKAKYIRVN